MSPFIFFPTFFIKATFHILTAGGDQVLQVRGGWYSTLPWALRSARDQHWCGILLLSLLAKTFTVQLIPKLRMLPSRCSSRGPHCGLLISPYPGWHPESRCFVFLDSVSFRWTESMTTVLPGATSAMRLCIKTVDYQLLNCYIPSLILLFLVPKPNRPLADLNHQISRPAQEWGLSKVISDHLLGLFFSTQNI